MRGYSKIKENNPFSQRSRSKKDKEKEYPFLDQDVDQHFSTPSSRSEKESQDLDQQLPTINVDNKNKNKNKNKGKNDFFLGKTGEEETGENRGKKIDAALKRNFSVSSATTSYQKTKGSGNQQLDRQSSARSIQEAVKRAFSVKRSSSVNYSDRYCRIYDQPLNGDNDDDDNYDFRYDYEGGDYNNGNDGTNNNEDDFERRNNGGSMEMRSKSMKNKDYERDHHNNGKKHVGSKVVKACKRLFSR